MYIYSVASLSVFFWQTKQTINITFNMDTTSNKNCFNYSSVLILFFVIYFFLRKYSAIRFLIMSTKHKENLMY